VDPPVLQHSACGLQAYLKALLVAVAAISTREMLDGGGGRDSLNLSCASCRFCVMYKGGIPVSESSAVGCP